MNNIAVRARLLAFVLALLLLPFAPRAFAQADGETVRGIYEALLAEDSSYSETKATYAEYYPETVFEETLGDDGFTLSVSGNEYFEGSWTYTLDGDYLVSTLSAEDYTGLMMSQYVLNAVGICYEMNTQLLNGYIIGLNAMELENSYYIVEDDEENGTTTVRIYVAGPYDMKELDEMLLDTPVLDYEPMTESEYRSMASNCGKLSMVANGTAGGLTIYVGEYGGLDELAYQSMRNVVKVLQPVGWETFLENYTELADAGTEDYTVALNVDIETVAQDFEPRENVSYARLRFGEEESYDEWVFTDWPPIEALTEHYFRVLANVETGTAGASLKTARAACLVCGFASAYDLHDPDVEQLRDNLAAAFAMLDGNEQTAFWQGFAAVRELLDGCLEDYGARRAVFEDAGLAEEMDMNMDSEQVLSAWENLRDLTLAMGNETAG